jgi:hypothetical protein
MLPGCERLSTFVLDFSAFFAAFLATFAAFLATFAAFLALLVFLAIFAVLQLWLRESWAALRMSQGPPIFKEPFFLIESFSPVAHNFPALRPRALALLNQPAF